MKLSLEDLRVDSYAEQVCETELTQIKGGTSAPCWAAGAAVVSAGVALWDAATGGGGTTTCTTTTTTTTSGGTTTTTTTTTCTTQN